MNHTDLPTLPAGNQRVLLHISDLLNLANEWRAEHLSIGFTCGAFDLLHAGHADYLDRAKVLCNRLVVAVNSDEAIRRYKSPHRPIVRQEHRLNLIASLRSVDAAILMHETRPATLIGTLRPDVYIKGGDYAKNRLRSAALVESYGGRCEIVPIKCTISSSNIIARIEEMSRYAPPESTPTYKNPIVFLDRDGTLIEDVHFLKDPRRVKLLPGVGEGLHLLKTGGFRLVMVSNQQGIGLGYLTYDEFVATNSQMLRQLASYDVGISKFYYCPHSMDDKCDCRKPGSKLLSRALADFGVPAECCFMIGNARSDVDAARAAGCTGVLIAGNGTEMHIPSAPSFLEAAQLILELRKQSEACKNVS